MDKAPGNSRRRTGGRRLAEESSSQPRRVSVESARILIQKFGGTSVATAEARHSAVERIEEARRRGFLPVVVVSAMGRQGEPYATDTLLNLVRLYGVRNRRELDLLMSCGEIISTVIVAHDLREAGFDAVALTGFQAGILTDGNHGEALVRNVSTDRILTALEDGAIPVVAGFQGIAMNGDVTTLGRGGSDTTAVALGAALKAGGVEIYTDVDGILTADPRILPEAVTVSDLTYEEAGELCAEGAKVLHPRSVDLAAQYQVPLWVKATHKSGGGSRISGEMPRDALEKTRVVTSVAAVGSVMQIVVEGLEPKLRVQMFRSLADAGVSLDVINVARRDVYFMVRGNQSREAVAVLERLGIVYQRVTGCAKIAIVGIGMRGTPGVMARIQQALYSAEVEALHSTDSNIAISCLIREQDVAAAVSALHKEFGLSRGGTR